MEWKIYVPVPSNLNKKKLGANFGGGSAYALVYVAYNLPLALFFSEILHIYCIPVYNVGVI